MRLVWKIQVRASSYVCGLSSFSHVYYFTPLHTQPLAPCPVHTQGKKKVSTLKNMFWSQPDVYTKYMDHVLPSSESSDEDEGVNEDDEYSNDDNEDADDGDNLVDGELKDFEFDVNDKLDSYCHGDELTTAGWLGVRGCTRGA